MKPRRQSVDFATGIGELLGGILCAGTSGDWTLASATRYVYDGWRVIQERDGSNVPTVSYTRGTDLSGSLEGAGGIGGLLARSHGYSSGNWTTHNCYHADGNGNITYLVNSSQTVAASYRYDPFGNTLSSSGSLAGANVYRFSSKEFHATSSLYYYGYRFYDPSVQRWLNRDPIEERGGLNLYAFVFNKPTRSIDAWGLRECPVNHKPCGTLSSTEEMREPDGRCYKACNYAMDPSNPIVRRKFDRKSVYMGDGESLPIVGSATPYIIDVGPIHQGGTPLGSPQRTLGIGIVIPCDEDCPQQMYCGRGKGPAGGPQIVW